LYKEMATVGRANNASYLNTSRLSYISTAPFNNDFYTYSTAIVNRATVGVMVPVADANAGNCPAGRVLRETGRKLVPGANPMPAGYNTYMVSVYDAQTGLTGFIDPNARIFAIYNTDKPNFLLDGVDPNAGETDQGLSVYTQGSGTFGNFISTASYLTVAGNALVGGNLSTLGSAMVAGNLLVAGSELVGGNLSTIGNVVAGANVTARKFTTSPIAVLAASAGSASSGSATLNGSVGVQINTTACTGSSIVLATMNVAGDPASGIAVVPNNGFFTVYAAAGKTFTFYWLVLN